MTGHAGARGRAAVVGAGGFVGMDLVPRLVAEGFDVHALVRDPSGFHARDHVEIPVTDVADVDSATRALDGCETAYSLVDAMAGGPGFAERDRDLASAFADAAGTCSVRTSGSAPRSLGRRPACRLVDDRVREEEALVLRSFEWFCGEAWLGFLVAPDGSPAIEQVGSLRTKEVLGMACWWLLWPIHQFALRAMVRHRRARVRRCARSRTRRRPVPGVSQRPGDPSPR